MVIVAQSNISTVANISNQNYILPETLAPSVMLHMILVMVLVASLFLYITPFNQVMQVVREQTQVKDLTSWLVPIYLMFVQSYLWACYGYSTGLSHLASFNTLGALVCMAYLGAIARNAQPHKLAQQIIFTSVLVVMLFSGGVWMFSASPSVLGHVAFASNIAMVLVPLVDATKFMQMRTLDKFPLGMAAASFFSGMLWAQYAMLVHDQLLLAANRASAAACGLELLAVYWIFWGSNGMRGNEADHQPLMPRRKAAAVRNCGNLFGFLSFGQRPSKHPRPVAFNDHLHTKLRDHFRYTTFGEAPHEEASPSSTLVSDRTRTMSSPFGALDYDEDVEDLEESQFEPEVNTMADAFPLVSSGTSGDAVLASGFFAARDDTTYRGATDCIL
jgi:uncharacterized protein with PQ loop repeat